MGGGGGADASSSGISEMHFWQTDPKIFLRAPKKGFFDCFFFSKICLRRRKLRQNRGKTVLWESSKNQFGRPKKKKVVKSQNFGKFFLKIRPPRENPRSAPASDSSRFIRFIDITWSGCL